MEKYCLFCFETRQSWYCHAPNYKKALEYLAYLAKLDHVSIYDYIIRWYDYKKLYVLYTSHDEEALFPTIEIDY